MICLDNDLRRDFKNSINSIYFKIKQTLEYEDYSYYRFENIEYEFEQILNSIQKVEDIKQFKFVLNGKKPKKIESFFYSENSHTNDSIIKIIICSKLYGKIGKSKYELKVENYLNQMLEYLDIIVMIIK